MKILSATPEVLGLILIFRAVMPSCSATMPLPLRATSSISAGPIRWRGNISSAWPSRSPFSSAAAGAGGSTGSSAASFDGRSAARTQRLLPWRLENQYDAPDFGAL